MKTSFRLILIVCVCTFLYGCKAEPGEAVPTPSTQATPTSTVTPTATATPTPTEVILPAYNIVINEVQSDNKFLTAGTDADWVELYNGENFDVSLEHYSLSDDEKLPSALPLTGTIPAEGYLVIFLDGEAAFRLSSEGDTVGLYYRGESISSLTVPTTENGESHGPNGSYSWQTPGHANTKEGYLAYLDGLTLPGLNISEVVTSNKTHMPVDGECYDFIEITNTSDAPISLGDYTLTDKRSEPGRYQFPDITLAPGEFYIVYCSGDSSLGANHAPFKLSSSGETVYLASDGNLTDALCVPSDLKSDESFGRYGNRPMYLQDVTPGKANSDGYLTALAAPAANHSSGIYADAITVELTASGKIYYTLDGSRPTTKSAVYKKPISIKDTTTIRALCVDGERSTLTAYTYIIGPEHELPVLSVAISDGKLTGDKGVLNHIDQDYEYEAMLTLIENGTECFSVPCGFRLHGNDSRKGAKQNFQLRFRSEYGVGKLDYPLFENREFTEYNSLLLKGGSEDFPTAIMRDELATGLVDGTTALYAQAIKPVVLYLGGEYWGIYYIRERFSDDYVASHLGVSEESVDLLEVYNGVQSGSRKDYAALLDYVASHDMSTSENYAYLCEKVDINSLMDWYICRSYMGDKDLANIRYFRSSESDGKWRWMYFDLDWAFWHTQDKPFTSIVKNTKRHALILAALKSSEGQDAFLRRYDALMDSILNETYITNYIDTLASTIESEVPRDRQRWGYTVKKWESSVEKLRAYVRDGARTANVLADLQEYFHLSDAQMAEYFE